MQNSHIEKSRLAQFCDTIIMQARSALYDREDDILKAWHENIEEAQQNDKKFPPLKLAISATVDLEESKIETTLRFTAVYQSRIEAEIADPNQPDLPGVNEALEKYAKAVCDDNARKIEALGEFQGRFGEGEPEEVLYRDADEEKDEESYVELDDFEIQQLLMDLEKAPKMQRRKRMGEMLEKHGPDLIHKFAKYSEWNQPDKHLLKVIEMRAATLAGIDKRAAEIESEPEDGAADY